MENPSFSHESEICDMWVHQKIINPQKNMEHKHFIFFSSSDQIGSMTAVNFPPLLVPTPSYTHCLHSSMLSSGGSKDNKVNLLLDENIHCFLLKI